MIMLNGQKVPGHDVKVRANFRLEDKDLSGMSSATDTAEGGIKPQTLSVSLIIKFDDKADLTRLIAMARAIDEAGKRMVYDIYNESANAGNIRKVRFTENFNYTEADSQRKWNVSFTLRECESVPEKIEQRQEQPAATEQTAEGDTVGSTATEGQTTETLSAPAPAAEMHGTVWQMMKKFDAILGG